MNPPDVTRLKTRPPLQEPPRRWWRRILSTHAVRLAGGYALVYLLVLAVVWSLLSWWSTRSIDESVRTGLSSHAEEIMDLARNQSPEAFRDHIDRLSQAPKANGRLYLLMEDNLPTAGSIHDWPEEVDLPIDGQLHTLWIEDDVLPVRLFADDAYLPVIAQALDAHRVLLIAQHVEQSAALHEVAEYLLEQISLAVLLGLIFSVLISSRILKRMETVRHTAANIMTGDLNQRIPLSRRNDEFDALANHLNAMLDRIQQLIQGIREVTDNIAHDLRSPLGRLRNQLDAARVDARNGKDPGATIDQAISEADGLIRTFNALLSIAQAEAGNHRGEWHDVDLYQLSHDLVDLFSAAAEQKQQQILLEPASGNALDAMIQGSRDLLAQALSNLIENALKYTQIGGTIRCRVSSEARHVTVTVSDNGPGIRTADHHRVLQRFVRLDDSRQASGNGLGLSLVHAVATLYQADLTLQDLDPGLAVSLTLPRRKQI